MFKHNGRACFLRRTFALLFGVLTGLSLVSTTILAQEKKPFYRGGLDHKKAKAPNGAIVNEDYKEFLLDGPFSQGQRIKSCLIYRLIDKMVTIPRLSLGFVTAEHAER